MDRYIVREPRVITDYPQGNQMIAFSSNIGASNNLVRAQPAVRSHMFSHVDSPTFAITNASGSLQHTTLAEATTPMMIMPAQGHMLSGIDPRYLAPYTDNSAQFIVTGHQMYRNSQSPSYNEFPSRSASTVPLNRNTQLVARPSLENKQEDVSQQLCGKSRPEQCRGTTAPVLKEVDSAKAEVGNRVMSRSEKLKELYKSGTRVFTGSVEKVLKWHKALQDIGVLVYYEVLAKCVSISPGAPGSKHLVLRDERGPALQAVYYETDFLLPDFSPPCMLRVVGRMAAGSCRLHAFCARAALAHELSAAPRRQAAADLHVRRLQHQYATH